MKMKFFGVSNNYSNMNSPMPMKSLEDRVEIWKNTDYFVTEPWESICAQDGCNVTWTEQTTIRNLFWCRCISDGCKCEGLADDGCMWCVDHIPDYLKLYDVTPTNKDYLCNECAAIHKDWDGDNGDDELIEHRGTTITFFAK